MRDNNILPDSLSRRTKGRYGFCELAVFATLVCNVAGCAGANAKDVQAQMRHSRVCTTMDIYPQFVPESQRRAVDRLADGGEADKEGTAARITIVN